MRVDLIHPIKDRKLVHPSKNPSKSTKTSTIYHRIRKLSLPHAVESLSTSDSGRPTISQGRENAFPNEILVETVIICQLWVECRQKVQALTQGNNRRWVDAIFSSKGFGKKI